MREAVVVASSRTALAKSFRGSFNMTRPDDLAAHCIQDVLRKTPQLDPAEIEDVILGCGQPHGVARTQRGAYRRHAGRACRFPWPAITVNRFCSSGLQAIAMAAHQIMHEGADAAIGGGVESISMAIRDSSPNPATAGNNARNLHGDGRHRRSGRQALQHQPRRRRTNIRCSASSAPRARSRKASSRRRSRR